MTEEKIKAESKEASPTEEKTDASPEEKPGRDPVKRWTSVVLVTCLILFAWHLLADKYTPYTSNGRVEAFVVPIAPQVSGQLAGIYVINNQRVTAGQEMAVIDKSNYELAVQRAEAELQQASQTSAADVAAVSTAQAKVAEAKANLSNAKVKGQRIIKLSKRGAASVSRADDARTRIEASEAKLASARSELEKAKSNLGASGLNNARIRSALTALETAELDLYRTTIRAPADGIITNLTVDIGHFANSGSPIMTFIATKDTWVQADMRENCLGHIEKGDLVEMVLDAAPGKIIKGEVMSVGYGVSDDSSNTLGGLATVQTSQGWLRQAQHFPVLIGFVDTEAKGLLRAGGQVNVIVYTGSRPLMNTLGRLWIRLISVLSHLY